MQDSLLSRFDLLFIVLDQVSQLIQCWTSVCITLKGRCARDCTSIVNFWIESTKVWFYEYICLAVIGSGCSA